MKDIAVPPLVPATTEGNLADLPARNGAGAPRSTRRSPGARARGGSTSPTAQFARRRPRAWPRGWSRPASRLGDRVAIMSKTRYEWTARRLRASGPPARSPCRSTRPRRAEQVSWILADSGASRSSLETAAHARTLGRGARRPARPARRLADRRRRRSTSCAAAGADVTDAELDARRARRSTAATIATIIYTSGTTGRPKGCELTHGNFMALAENTVERLGDVVSADGASTLLFLPLAHVFARFIQVLVRPGRRPDGPHRRHQERCSTTSAASSRRSSSPCPACSRRSTTPPRQKADAEGKGKIFAGRRRRPPSPGAERPGRRAAPVSPLRAASTRVFDRLVYTKLRAAMGGKVQYAVSGGAPLGARLGHFFRGIGVTVLEGYGLTETTAPATVNRPTRSRSARSARRCRASRSGSPTTARC